MVNLLDFMEPWENLNKWGVEFILNKNNYFNNLNESFERRYMKESFSKEEVFDFIDSLGGYADYN